MAIAHDGRAILAQATDISEGGVALIVQGTPPPEGATVCVSFKLPTSPGALDLSARVIHVMRSGDDFYLGLQFARLDDAAKKLVRRYINTRRFLFGDLRAPSSSPIVGQRMTERLRRLRRHVALM
ncbi:MAG: PilZ domain-containing protein [Deltaproteobacteria bacterium]|nr:PilZ domain-containing protein [Deltaproteobacteria bacterium]